LLPSSYDHLATIPVGSCVHDTIVFGIDPTIVGIYHPLGHGSDKNVIQKMTI
jgi:hypothetical protein